MNSRKRVTDGSLTITKASLDQAALLALLIRQAYADVARRFDLTAQNAPTHPSLSTADWVRSDHREGGRYYLASCGEMIVGCAARKAASPIVCHLMRLAVLPMFRGQGIGGRLVSHVCRQARREGASELSIGLIAAQEALAEWYRRKGFTAVEQRRFAHLPFEVLFMRLELVTATDSL